MKPYEYDFERRVGMKVYFRLSGIKKVGVVTGYNHYYTYVTDGRRVYALTRLNCWPKELSGNRADNIQIIPKEGNTMAIKDKAKKLLGVCELIEGLEKIENDLLVATYPDGFTIDGVAVLKTADEKTGEDKEFIVFTIKEAPGRYGAGGKILTETFQSLMKDYQSAEEFNAALKAEGGLKVKLSIKKSRSSGNKYTAVEIVD